ncbi:12247_t:CDS:2 [Ambispora gerdemannii]|uniref:12247_t:CDS:1 n=1 Tax=Ambispora gerdemannii TaxID=144530 RepID=A0A9N9C5E1_9GLOM|nr:12247_t:CDS:2 [Ambispora gerdemannii]
MTRIAFIPEPDFRNEDLTRVGRSKQLRRQQIRNTITPHLKDQIHHQKQPQEEEMLEFVNCLFRAFSIQDIQEKMNASLLQINGLNYSKHVVESSPMIIPSTRSAFHVIQKTPFSKKSYRIRTTYPYINQKRTAPIRVVFCSQCCSSSKETIPSPSRLPSTSLILNRL